MLLARERGAPPAQAAAEGAAGNSGQRAGRGAAGGAGLDPRLFLLGLTACHAVNDLYGLVVPPLLPAIQEAFRLNYLQLGLISFSTTVVSAVAQPLVGYAADLTRKRRLALLVGFLLYPPAMLLLAVAPTYAALLGAGALLGLAASTYHPQSTTLLFDRFRERRGRRPACTGWATGSGSPWRL